VPAPDEDAQADRYEQADDRLGAAGLRWYEISNWARPGHECRHHLLYWAQGDYVAIGAAAHGHRDGVRAWNVRTPERYIARIRAGAEPEAGREHLDPGPRTEEALALALRTRGGAVLPPGAAPEADGLAAEGLLRRAGSWAVLTRRGRLLATAVTVRLLAAAAAPPANSPLALGRIDCQPPDVSDR
jgi:oxygen-independent coproporphyrinogen-3 oxidase